MSNPRLEQFASDLHQEVLAKAGIDADSAGETNQPLREEAFTEYVVGLLAEHNEADGVVRALELDEEQFPGVKVRYVVWD